jgi:hypothetical protein
LPVNYFHLVFSLPHSLVPLIWQNRKVLFTLLFDASAATLLEVAADPKHFGAEIGFLSILHTWGQTLQPHPHIHCVVPGGGPSPDHERWRSTPGHFFLPVRVLSRVFRGKFVAGLRRAFRANQLAFYGECLSLANEQTFAAFLRTLFQEDWVVYAKPPFGGPEHVLHYLARYTHRVAISNHRILEVKNSQVAFRWKDYAHHNKQRTMTLTCDEFLRRFLCPRDSRAFVTPAGSPTGPPSADHQKDGEQLMSSVRISEILEQVAAADKRGEKPRDGPSGVSCAGSVGIWFENYANVYIRHDIRCEEGPTPKKRVRVSFKREVCPKFEH